MASTLNHGNGPYTLNGRPPSPPPSASASAPKSAPTPTLLDTAYPPRASLSSDDEPPDTASTTLSTVTSPPYWLNSGSRSHRRTASSMSTESVLPVGAITLRDNDTSEPNDRNNACWAKSVEIADYTVVNGGAATNVGAFVVWNIRVETLSGSFMNVRKRYSEFDEFRRQLVQSFPNSEAAMPSLPPKSMISRFRPRFLEKRRAGLQYFLNCILLNPEFSGSPVLKDFLFA
jgi:hypothetical protein